MVSSIKDTLRRTFATKANTFASTLSTLSLALSSLEGDLPDQLTSAQRLSLSLPPLSTYLTALESHHHACLEANIEENDFTTYTFEELAYELDLVKASVGRKLAFLENQLVARDMTNLTPIQLEEFESVFRHFDREGRNSLTEVEFAAALASLGLVYGEAEMHDVFAATATSRPGIAHSGPLSPVTSPGANGMASPTRGTVMSPTMRQVVDFEGFIRFMVGVTEDQNTAEQVFQSFREVADGKAYVTEVDLRHSLVPEDVIEELVRSMPVVGQVEDGERGYDYVGFMEGIVGGGGGGTKEGVEEEMVRGLSEVRVGGGEREGRGFERDGGGEKENRSPERNGFGKGAL